MFGLDAVLTALETGDNSILLSASQDQADLLIDKALEHAQRLEIDVIAANKSEIILPNGAKLIARPANFRTVQGFDGNVWFDEFAWVYNNKRLFEVAAPIAARGDRRITIGSTPFEMGDQFYEIMDGMSGRFQLFSRHVVSVDDAVNAGCPVNIAELLDLYDPVMFDCFFRCRYFESGNSLIDYDVILKAQGQCLNALTEGELNGGMDIGRTRDVTEFIFVEQLEKVYVRRMETLKKTPFDEQKRAARGFLKAWTFKSFNIDQTGIGMNIAEDLHREFPRIVRPITFTAENKERMALNIKELFDTEKIMIPFDHNLIAQIHAIKRSVSGKGFKYDAKRSEEIGHADKFWALALACMNLGINTKKLLTVKVI
jgi:phage FluMu gp28-like protein